MYVYTMYTQVGHRQIGAVFMGAFVLLRKTTGHGTLMTAIKLININETSDL